MNKAASSPEYLDIFVSEGLKSENARQRATAIIVQALIEQLDMDRYRILEKKHIGDNLDLLWDVNRSEKFFNLPYWIENKIDLFFSAVPSPDQPQKILDIGCGAGHFLLVAKLFGHETYGLDRSIPIFNDITNFFGIEKSIHTIKPLQPLPKFPQKFDLITAHLVNFNNNSDPINGYDKEEWAWGEEEWNFFFTDLATNTLSENGAVEMLLNPLTRAKTGLRHSDGSLLNYFKKIGATIKNEEMRIIRLDDLNAFK